MTDYAIARALHVLTVVIWIGGVCMVTTILLPSIRKNFPSDQQMKIFHKIEHRFAMQARITTLIAGMSGFYMIWRLNLWDRFHQSGFWWLHAMVTVWLIFTVMLFVLEPFVLNRKFAHDAEQNPDKTYYRVQIMHWILLTLSLITVAGAVMGSIGYNLF